MSTLGMSTCCHGASDLQTQCRHSDLTAAGCQCDSLVYSGLAGADVPVQVGLAADRSMRRAAAAGSA